MTNRQLVEQVYLVLSGGQAADDTNVKLVDIESALPSFVDDVNLAAYRAMRAESSAAANGDVFSSDAIYSSLSTIEFTADYSSDDKCHIATMTKMPLSGASAMHDVSIKNNEAAQLIRFASRSDAFLSPFKGYFLDGDKIYLRNLPTVSTPTILFRSIFKCPSALGDDDQVPVIEGYETVLMDKLIAFFAKQLGITISPPDNVQQPKP